MLSNVNANSIRIADRPGDSFMPLPPPATSDALQDTPILVRVENLVKYFPVSAGFFRGHDLNVHAVDGVDLIVRQGETLGLVGESGCGKTT